MLEILAIVWLCNKNKANALKRGRKPGGFIALTLVLWLGLELLGGIIGGASGLGFGAYLLALCMAIIGGLIAYAVSKNCKPGQYVPPQQQMASAIAQAAEPLSAPAQLWVVRDSSMVGAMARWDFTLNGQPIGSLGNGSHLNAVAAKRQNILCARDAYGTDAAPFVFDAPPGGLIEIHFKANRFLPEQSRGFLPPTQPAQAAGQMPIQPVQAVQTAAPPAAAAPDAESRVPAEAEAAPAQAAAGFCMQCGAGLIPGADVCARCGAQRFVQNAGDPPQPPGAPAGVQPAAAAYAVPAAAVPPVPAAGWPAGHPPASPMGGEMAAAPGSAAPSGQPAVALLTRGDAMRVIWTGAALVIGWMLLWLAQGLFKESLRVNHDAGYILTTAMTGVAVYLVIQGSLRDWIAGGVLAFLSVCLESFNQYIFLTIVHGAPEFSFNFIVNGWILLRTALVIGLAALLAYLTRKQNKVRFFSSAGAAAGAYFLFQVLQLLFSGSEALHAADIAVRWITLLPRTAILWLAIQFARHISRMPRTPVRLRGAGLVWAWLAVAGMGLSLLVLLLVRQNQTWIQTAAGIPLALCGLTGYILLLCHKRTGLYVLLAGVGLMLTAQFVNSLAGHIYGVQQYAALWIGSLLGGVNPLLGWLSVRSADRRDAAEQLYRMQLSGAAPAFAGAAMPSGTLPAYSMPQAAGAGGAVTAPGMAPPFGPAPGTVPPFAAYGPYGRPFVRPVSGLHKFTAVFNIATGAFWTLFPVPFMVREKFHWAMLLMMFLGMLLCGAGIWCFAAQRAAQRSGQKAYPTWMKVVGAVFFILSALVLLAILTVIISRRFR